MFPRKIMITPPLAPQFSPRPRISSASMASAASRPASWFANATKGASWPGTVILWVTTGMPSLLSSLRSCTMLGPFQGTRLTPSIPCAISALNPLICFGASFAATTLKLILSPVAASMAFMPSSSPYCTPLKKMSPASHLMIAMLYVFPSAKA